ncbi:MAG: hypothetical protein JNM25_00645, partial [Planctomycetes bacterium]|nr:hypothetical protein [Planctomycetota bacterium]
PKTTARGSEEQAAYSKARWGVRLTHRGWLLALLALLVLAIAALITALT